MRTILFTLMLTLYGFSALEMHEWVRVPQVVAHLLEHHSDWGHHDKEVDGHEEHEGDHNPFDNGCDEVLCACSSPAFLPVQPAMTLWPNTSGLTLSTSEQMVVTLDFNGNVWNPPKRA